MLSKPASSPPRQLALAGCNVVPRTSATVLLYSATFRRCMPFVPGSSTWTAPPEPVFAPEPWPPVPTTATEDAPLEHAATAPARIQQATSQTNLCGAKTIAATCGLKAPQGAAAS